MVLGKVTQAADGGGGEQATDVEVQDSRPATAGSPAPVGAARQAAEAPAAVPAGRAAAATAPAAAADSMDVDGSDEMDRLRRKVARQQEKKRRQRSAARARKKETEAKAKAEAVAPASSTSDGGGPPSLRPSGQKPVDPTFLFGASSGAPPTPSGVHTTRGGGGFPAVVQERRVRCPALMSGPGDMALGHAQSMLIEKVSAMNTATTRAAQSDWASHVSGRERRLISCPCTFPGHKPVPTFSFGGSPQVTLLVGSVGAAMSSTELGNKLDALLTAELDDERLRQFVLQLAKQQAA